MAADALSILETPTIVRKAAARRPAGTPEDRLEGVGTPHSILKVGVAYQRIDFDTKEKYKLYRNYWWGSGKFSPGSCSPEEKKPGSWSSRHTSPVGSGLLLYAIVSVFNDDGSKDQVKILKLFKYFHFRHFHLQKFWNKKQNLQDHINLVYAF